MSLFLSLSSVFLYLSVSPYLPLCLYLCVCLSLCLSLPLSLSSLLPVSLYQSVSLSLSLSICPSLCLLSSLSACLSLCQSVSLSLSFCLLSISITTRPPVHTALPIQSHHQLILGWNSWGIVLICGRRVVRGVMCYEPSHQRLSLQPVLKAGQFSSKAGPSDLNLALPPTALWPWVNCASVMSSLSLDIIKLKNITDGAYRAFTICQA